MVRGGDAERGWGFYRALTGESAEIDQELRPVVELASDALLHGWADPMGLLERGGTDWYVAQAIVADAVRKHHEDRQRELEAMARMIGAEVGNRIAEIFSG